MGCRHMGLHRVTCHPTQVNAPRLNPSQTDRLVLIYQPRRDGRLSWTRWLDTYRDGLPVSRQSPIQVVTGHDVDQLHPYSNNDPARYRLRSATGTNYSVPRTRTKFGDRAFSVAGPVVWNSLPAAVRHADSLHSFKRRLKRTFSLCLMIDSVMPFRSRLAHGGQGTKLPSTYLLTYYVDRDQHVKLTTTPRRRHLT